MDYVRKNNFKKFFFYAFNGESNSYALGPVTFFPLGEVFLRR